jgi:hypothetical protein
MSKAYLNLVGTPYNDKNCWDIVLEFYRITYSLELKRYYDELPVSRNDAKSLIFTNLGDFSKVEDKDKSFGDIILLKLYGVESHVGVYLGDDLLLHTTFQSGCVVDRLLRWRHLIVGFYRAKKDDTTS